MRHARRTGNEFVFGKFLLASLPGWLIAFMAAVLLAQTTDVNFWVPFALLVVWIAADLATFPYQRRYFVSDPPDRRILGERGVAVSKLAPHGFVRVHGELWQARAASGAAICEGEQLRVCDVHGLELVVERVQP